MRRFVTLMAIVTFLFVTMMMVGTQGQKPIQVTYKASHKRYEHPIKTEAPKYALSYQSVFISQAHAQSMQPFLVPGLVLGLRHNLNQERISPNNYMVFFSAPAGAPVKRMDGGDRGATPHRGYEWWMVNDIPSADPNTYILPPGIVFALKHNLNQGDQKNIALFGRDPITGPDKFSRFKKYVGGDLGGGTHAGDGYYWYESTGEGFSNWGIIDNLPRWTVVGLKHSRNQRDKVFVWGNKEYDPVNRNIPPPSGFVRVSGGDIGASAGEGYYWYEKIIGPEVVSIPNLTARLNRSLFLSASDTQGMDRDHDGLVDMLEGELATIFSPYFIFDRKEEARQQVEPVVIFQVIPVYTESTPPRIGIRWVFLFARDGGYGPDAGICSGRDAHPGDNDDAYYELISRDNGLTWTITKIKLSFKGLEWPRNSRLEVHELTHPIIYMSASKHHEYFTRDRDRQDDSLYSDHYCNDNVDGKGAQILADVRSFRGKNPQIPYNNVGEFDWHPSPPFVNDLSYFYSGQSAWRNQNFYSPDCGPILNRWIPRWLP